MNLLGAIVLVIALAAVLAPPLYAGAVRFRLRRNVARIQAGDFRPVRQVFAADVHFVFPGESSWKADVRGRDAVAAWERRFVDAGLQLQPHEILVDGPPWNTRIALHFRDHLTAADGERVYENAGVIFATARWGKVIEFVVYEDTQKLGPLDAYLASRASEPVGQG